MRAVSRALIGVVLTAFACADFGSLQGAGARDASTPDSSSADGAGAIDAAVDAAFGDAAVERDSGSGEASVDSATADSAADAATCGPFVARSIAVAPQATATCNGVLTALTTPSNCGACGRSCGAVSCVAGYCKSQPLPGYDNARVLGTTLGNAAIAASFMADQVSFHRFDAAGDTDLGDVSYTLISSEATVHFASNGTTSVIGRANVPFRMVTHSGAASTLGVELPISERVAVGNQHIFRSASNMLFVHDVTSGQEQSSIPVGIYARPLVAFGDRAAWSEGSQLGRFEPDKMISKLSLDASQIAPIDLTMDDVATYGFYRADDTTTVLRWLHSASVPERVTRITDHGGASGQLTATPTHLYLSLRSGAGNAYVVRIDKCSGEAVTLAAPSLAPLSLFVGGPYVYAADGFKLGLTRFLK
jgi:hypothetical protein